jgi:small subunit ribosomal protein S21
MTAVTPKDGESIEAMLKRFSRKVEESGLLQDLKAKQAYVKPSDARRKELKAAKSRMRKQKAKMDEYLQFQSENKFRPKKKNNNYSRSTPNLNNSPKQNSET